MRLVVVFSSICVSPHVGFLLEKAAPDVTEMRSLVGGGFEKAGIEYVLCSFC